MNVGIIPARGGSKRIPRKNIREFCGKPMIAWSIDAALKSNCFDRLIVSTDDDKIASVAEAHGAEVPFIRPSTLADDHTGLGAVLRHAVQWFDEQSSDLSLVCCIFATAPFLTAELLQQGLALLRSAPNRSFVVSATHFPFPIQRAFRIAANQTIEPLSKENMAKRSQDLEPAYHEAGQFFWGRPDAIRNRISIYHPDSSLPLLIPSYRVQDIDTLDDWSRAEYLQQALSLSENHANCISS
jgi:N-acylneuraminate cytidylyltransferase